MFTARSLRGPRWQRYAIQQRAYSVSIPGDSHGRVKTIADLKEFQSSPNVSDVQVYGWVRSVRKSAGVRFADVTDGSSMRPIQAVIDKSLALEFVSLLNHFKAGQLLITHRNVAFGLAQQSASSGLGKTGPRSSKINQFPPQRSRPRLNQLRMSCKFSMLTS